LVAVEGQGGKGSPFTLLLVSRRSCLRQGRRFIMRGIDKEGNVANFVETEQVHIHFQLPSLSEDPPIFDPAEPSYGSEGALAAHSV
jgi:hypothetical protein